MAMKHRQRKIDEAAMSTVDDSEPLIREARVTEEEISAHLVDGRTISIRSACST